MSLESRFWSKVRKTDGCWLWIGGKGHNGYGTLYVAGAANRQMKAHRLSWRIHFGTIPGGLWVLHHCDNPPCVRPDHLFLGNRSDNMKDAGRKGRVCTIGKSRLTHCKRGHSFGEQGNTRIGRDGYRHCRACERARVNGGNRQAILAKKRDWYHANKFIALHSPEPRTRVEWRNGKYVDVTERRSMGGASADPSDGATPSSSLHPTPEPRRECLHPIDYRRDSAGNFDVLHGIYCDRCGADVTLPEPKEEK